MCICLRLRCAGFGAWCNCCCCCHHRRPSLPLSFSESRSLEAIPRRCRSSFVVTCHSHLPTPTIPVAQLPPPLMALTSAMVSHRRARFARDLDPVVIRVEPAMAADENKRSASCSSAKASCSSLRNNRPRSSTPHTPRHPITAPRHCRTQQHTTRTAMHTQPGPHLPAHLLHTLRVVVGRDLDKRHGLEGQRQHLVLPEPLKVGPRTP